MNALIVDDERLARSELRRLLEQHPDVEIVGEAANADEAEQRLAELDVDLLLLDVQMPGATGFDLLDRLDRLPIVVFTTAYDAYALRAFEVNAFDYLVKPIRPERLASALEKARGGLLAQQAAEATRDRVTTETAGDRATTEMAGDRATTETTGKSRSASDRIFVRDGERCWIVTVADIALIEAEGNYSRVHFGANQPLIRTPLGALEKRLDQTMFFRANRGQLFNLRFVEAVDTAVDEGLTVRLRSGQLVNVSRRQSRRLRDTLSL